MSEATKKYKSIFLDDGRRNHKFVKRVKEKLVSVENVWSMCVWNDYLCCGLDSGEIRLFEIETGEHIRSLKAHDGIVCQLLLWGTNLVSGSNTGDLRIWNPSCNSKLLQIRKSPDEPAYPLFLCVANTHFLWTHASSSGVIQIFNDSQAPKIHKNVREKKNITAMNSSEYYVFTGLDYSYICKWSSAGEKLSSFPADYEFQDILNWNGRLACSARGGFIYVYSQSFTTPKRSINCPDYIQKFSLVECNSVLTVIGTKPPSIHLYSNRMVEIDCINEFAQGLCAWKDVLFVFNGHQIDVWKVKRPSWSCVRLLWIAFFKNQQYADCSIARLPKDMIRLIAKFVDSA